MSAAGPSFEAFAQRILQLLDEGRFVATYKYAVLLGLVDVVAETVDRKGRAPSTVRTRALASKVIDIYWPHTLQFNDQAGTLRQNQHGQAEIVSLIAAFRERTVGDASLPISRARWTYPEGFEKLIRSVEWKLIEMPLGKLQLIGNQYDPFIYDLGWTTTPRQAEVRSDDFAGQLHLLPGVGEHLLRSSPLLRPLVQAKWTVAVAKFNQLEQAELQGFLFNTERISLAPVSADLRRVAGGRCFYCNESVRGSGQIDHFIPWARRIDNGIHNLVFSHGACNGMKSVNLAAEQHLHRWLDHLDRRSGDLEGIADARHWPAHRDETLSAARAIYLRLPDGYKLWTGGNDFVPADVGALKRLLTV